MSCRVVFPPKDRAASRATAGDIVEVHLALDAGRREVVVPDALRAALIEAGVWETFEAQNYSTRKEDARHVSDAKADDTRRRRIEKIVARLTDAARR